MKAPRKIYLQVCGDCEMKDCDNCFFKDLEDDVTWSKDRTSPRDIEYTRTDAFIEKTVNWLINNTDITSTGIKNYRKAIKGK